MLVDRVSGYRAVIDTRECNEELIRDMTRMMIDEDSNKRVIVINPRFDRYFASFIRYPIEYGSSLIIGIFYSALRRLYALVFDPEVSGSFTICVPKPLVEDELDIHRLRNGSGVVC